MNHSFVLDTLNPQLVNELNMSKSMVMFMVDDDADYRFLVQQVFKRYLSQYSLRLFADGLELIQHIEQSAIDLFEIDQSKPDLDWPGIIVLDVDMPKLNGLQTLARLKQNPVWQIVPVVMMSNRIEPGFKETTIQLGATSYLTKPVDFAELQEIMEQLCHEWLVA